MVAMGNTCDNQLTPRGRKHHENKNIQCYVQRGHADAGRDQHSEHGDHGARLEWLKRLGQGWIEVGLYGITAPIELRA